MTPTEPGLPRSYYTGHARTEFLVAETQRAINEVVFSIEPTSKPLAVGVRALPGSELPPLPGQITYSESSRMSPGGSTQTSIAPTDTGADAARNRYSQVYMSPNLNFTGLPEVSNTTQESLGMHNYIGPISEGPPPQSNSPPPAIGRMSDPFAANPMVPPSPAPVNTDVGEFGAYSPTSYSPTSSQFAPRTTSLRNISDHGHTPAGPRGARFATFPVKLGGGGPRPPPSAPPVSFSTPQRMDDRAPSLEIERPQDTSLSSSIAAALGQGWVPENSRTPPNNPATDTYPPRYSVEAQPSHTPSATSPHFAEQGVHSSLANAPPLTSDTDDIEDTELAYMSPHDADVELPPDSAYGDHHVRSGAVHDEGTSQAPRISAEHSERNLGRTAGILGSETQQRM